MPELPEVETVRRGLESSWKGQIIEKVELRRNNLRYPFPPDFAERLEGRTVKDVRRRAKYLLADLDGGLTWLMHLGMTGRWTLNADNLDEKHNHVLVYFIGGGISVYNDVRRFGVMDLMTSHSHKLLDHLGPEPLDSWNADDLAQRLENRTSAIKISILDQKVVVGVGNIYASEALHRSGISPLRRSCDLTNYEVEILVTNIRAVLTEAIASGGSTLKDFKSVEGDLGYFSHHFEVYGKEGDVCKCGGFIRRCVLGGRSTFWCDSCQD